MTFPFIQLALLQVVRVDRFGFFEERNGIPSESIIGKICRTQRTKRKYTDFFAFHLQDLLSKPMNPCYITLKYFFIPSFHKFSVF